MVYFSDKILFYLELYIVIKLSSRTCKLITCTLMMINSDDHLGRFA